MKCRQLLKSAAYLTYGYLFVMFFAVLFFNIPGVYAFNIPQQVMTFLLGETLFIVGILLFQQHIRGWRLFAYFKANERKALVFGFLMLFILQVIFVSHFYTQTGYDGFMIYRAATGDIIHGHELTYFSNYPNNFLLLLLSHGIHQVNMWFGTGIDTYWLLVVINILVVDLTLYLIYALTQRLYTNKHAIYALTLAVLLLGLSPWLTSFYSDTLSLPIGLLVFYLYLKLKETSKLKLKFIYTFSIGILLYVGFLIKPSAVFSGIAIVVIELLLCNYKQLLKQSKKILVGLALTGSLLAGMLSVRLPYQMLVSQQQLVRYEEAENFPFTHWLMLGTNESTMRGYMTYGMWNMEDYGSTLHTSGKRAKMQKNIEVIHKRLHTFGVFGYAEHLWKKSMWILGDGTFFWGHEGPLLAPTDVAGARQFVQEIVYPKGRYYDYYAYILQTLWFIVLFAVAMSLFCIKKYANKAFFIMTCTIFGSIVFVLLFEGRSRYLLNNLGFIVIVASLGLEKIIKHVHRYQNKLKSM